MNRRDLKALASEWAKQEPRQGCDRVAMVIEVQSICESGADIHASVELDQATTLWLLRELQKMFG